jgi:hypothetical protein
MSHPIACKPLAPRSPPTRPSSTNPPPAPLLPKSRRTDHHTDTPNTTDPAGISRWGHFMPTHPHRQRRHRAHPECRSTRFSRIFQGFTQLISRPSRCVAQISRGCWPSCWSRSLLPWTSALGSRWSTSCGPGGLLRGWGSASGSRYHQVMRQVSRQVGRAVAPGTGPGGH